MSTFVSPSARALRAAASPPTTNSNSHIDRHAVFIVPSWFRGVDRSAELTLRRVGPFPRTDILPRLVEQPLVVALEDLLQRRLVDAVEHRLPHVVDREIGARVLGRDGVGAEEEALRMAVEHGDRGVDRLGRGDRVLGDLVPRDVEAQVRERGVVDQRLDHADVSWTGWMTRPRPVCAQMIVVAGCRATSAFICSRNLGRLPCFANGRSTSLWRMTTSPASAAKSRMRSSAG